MLHIVKPDKLLDPIGVTFLSTVFIISPMNYLSNFSKSFMVTYRFDTLYRRTRNLEILTGKVSLF